MIVVFSVLVVPVVKLLYRVCEYFYEQTYFLILLDPKMSANNSAAGVFVALCGDCGSVLCGGCVPYVLYAYTSAFAYGLRKISIKT